MRSQSAPIAGLGQVRAALNDRAMVIYLCSGSGRLYALVLTAAAGRVVPLGMTTALLAAGAGTVIASVTRVGDDASMGIMAALHGALARRMPPASALASALAGQGTGFVCFGAG